MCVDGYTLFQLSVDENFNRKLVLNIWIVKTFYTSIMQIHRHKKENLIYFHSLSFKNSFNFNSHKEYFYWVQLKFHLNESFYMTEGLQYIFIFINSTYIHIMKMDRSRSRYYVYVIRFRCSNWLVSLNNIDFLMFVRYTI